jgi:hypothetical protein
MELVNHRTPLELGWGLAGAPRRIGLEVVYPMAVSRLRRQQRVMVVVNDEDSRSTSALWRLATLVATGMTAVTPPETH